MKHLSYDDGTYRAEIDIRPATTGDGIQRGLLTYDLPKDDKLPFRARALFASLSVVSDIQKLEKNGQAIKLTPEILADDTLPDMLTTIWEMRVFEENQQWRAGLTADQLEELQKKLRKPSGGSEVSTEPQTKATKVKM